jgi:hypothetical protein
LAVRIDAIAKFVPRYGMNSFKPLLINVLCIKKILMAKWHAVDF